MQVKDEAESVATGDFWYDLFDGGYINPGDMLEDANDVQRVEAAMATVQQYRETLEAAGKIEEI